MRIAKLPFAGMFEEQGEIKENLRLAEPETDREQQLIARRLLSKEEIVANDHARRGYLFRYRLGDYLGDGLWALRIEATDQSAGHHGVEIAAGLALTGATGSKPAGINEGVPMWFLSRRLHHRIFEGTPQSCAGRAFGRLIIPEPHALPQRWLFGAAA